MIDHIQDFYVGDNLRESMEPAEDGFPFAAREVDVVEYVNNCAKWHWHGFAEFSFVVAGEVECCTPRGAFVARAGEGYFINADTLHMVRMAPGAADAKYRVLQFETGMLASAGVFSGKYVAPVERCKALEAVRLTRALPEQGRLLDEMSALFEIARDEPSCYELRVLERLAGVWACLYPIAEPILRRAALPLTDTASTRVKAMLAYIHAHYAEAMSVEEIAAAASISRREAFRAFRQVLGTTPTLYVLQHRINCGARRLMEGDDSVTAISAECGFSSPSYFCKAFHDLTGLSPREFRRREREQGG